MNFKGLPGRQRLLPSDSRGGQQVEERAENLILNFSQIIHSDNQSGFSQMAQ